MMPDVLPLFPQQCQRRRVFALRHPCRIAEHCLASEYGWTQPSPTIPYLMWSMRFVLERFRREPAQWHASIAMMGDVPGSENEFGKPEQGMAFVAHWPDGMKEEARELIIQLFGPLIRHADDSQQVLVTEGLSAVHVHLAYEKEVDITRSASL